VEYRLESHPPLRGLDDEALDALFRDGRTVYAFNGEPVPDETLQRIWDQAQWGPTSANSQPLRIVYCRTAEARERLADTVNRGNRRKVLSAGATALLAVDQRFHEHMPVVMPLRPDYREIWEEDTATRAEIGRLSATLQAGYFIMAVRAMGLAAGPFSGFDVDEVNAAFFPDTDCTAFMGVNIGYPADEASMPRFPRVPHDQVITWL